MTTIDHDPAGSTGAPQPDGPGERVLVGFDGSDQSHFALDWAVDAAKTRNCPLVVVQSRTTSFATSPVALHGVAYGVVPDAGSDAETGAALNVAVARLAEEHPGLEVRGQLVDDTAAACLVEASGRPGVVVIGSRGLGPVRAAVLGGVADQVVTHARGPVAVVPHEVPGDRTGAPVVVGADGSPSCRPAIEFALGVARRRGIPLELLRTIDPPFAMSPMDGLDPLSAMPVVSDVVVDEVKAVQEEHAESIRRENPDVDIRSVVQVGSAAGALLDRSDEAVMLVVGSRGRGGFAGLLLGSTSRRVIGAAHCPVVVVPHHD